MRINKYLASTLFTGLFVTAAYFTPAMGQEQSLQPQGTWAITKIDRSAQGGNSYCTLSRKYDDGIVLSLGRNQTEEYSMAIDFQKQVFEKDKSVKINLQPGPGQIRAYDMMPTSEKAVVVRLGWDTGFFDALNQSQQMKVKIADKGYSFAMPEIAKGQTDLQDCMEGLKTAAKGAKPDAQTKDVLNAQAGSATKEFDAGKVGEKVAAATPAPALPLEAQKEQVAEQEKSVLKNFADSIKAQEPGLNNDEGVKRRNFGSKNTESKPVKVAEAEDKVNAPLPPVAELPKAAPAPELIKRPPPSDPVIAAKPKDADVANKLAATSPAAQFEKSEADAKALQKADADLKASQQRMAELAAENQALKAKPAAPSPDTQKQIEAMKAEKAALQQKLELAQQEKDKRAKPEDVAAIEAKAKELEIKNAQLQDSLRQSQVRIGEAAINTETKSLRKIADLEVKLDAAQKDNAAMAKQLESLKLQQEDKSVTAIAGNWDLEQATKRFNEAEREIRRLGLQLEQERTNCNREKAQIEQMLFDPAVADKQQIERLSTLENQLKDAQAKLADSSKLVQDQVNQQLAAKTQTIEAEKNGMAAQIATLQKSMADRDAAINAEKGKMAQQIAGEKTALQTQIASMTTAMAQKDQQIAQEVGKARAAADQEIAALKTQNKALADAQAAASTQPKTDPKQMMELQAAINSIKADNSALNDQNIMLRAEADKLRLQLVDVTTNGSSRADRVASVQLENENLKRMSATKDTQTATYQNQLAVLQQENAQLKSRLTVSDSRSGSSTQEVGDLTRQIQMLQNQVSDLQSQKQRMSAASSYNNIAPAAGVYAPEGAAPVTPVQAQPIPISATGLPSGNAMSGYDKGSIQSLLQKAGLSVNGMSKASKGMAGADNFSWTESSNVKGLASIKTLGSTNFEVAVDQYIAYQKSQCGGDFASMPSPSNGSAAKRMALYEVACVNPGSESQSASLIFFEDQGRFIAISNQIAAADMDIAMDSRDKIAGFVRGL